MWSDTKVKSVGLRLSQEDLDHVDEQAGGDRNRSKYIRKLIQKDRVEKSLEASGASPIKTQVLAVLVQLGILSPDMVGEQVVPSAIIQNRTTRKPQKESPKEQRESISTLDSDAVKNSDYEKREELQNKSETKSKEEKLPAEKPPEEKPPEKDEVNQEEVNQEEVNQIVKQSISSMLYRVPE